MKPHKHRDIIIAWADGKEIEYKDIDGWKPVVSGSPAWFEDREYRIKPEARKYPQTLMTGPEMDAIWSSAPAANGDKEAVYAAHKALANAAIARAIEDVQVIAPSITPGPIPYFTNCKGGPA